MRFATLWGCLKVSSWAMFPPIDQPSTWALSMSNASSRAAASSAMVSMVKGASGASVWPLPRLSKVMTL